MRYDILSLGPVRMDVFVQLPEDEVVEVCSIDKKRCMIELGFGEKIAIQDMQFSTGGNAGNNAVGVKRLGMSAAVVGTVGNQWTDRGVTESLKKEGVETKYLVEKAEQKGFGVIINYQGERTILSYYSNTNFDWPDDAELNAGWIYLTSMGEGYEEFYKEAVEWAKNKGAKIAFNPGTRQIKAGMEHLKYAYEATEVLFVNKEEAEELLQRENGVPVKELLSGLFSAGPKTVVITNGPDGTYAYDGVRYVHMPIVPAVVVERTGAGDAFGSGFLAAYMSGKSIDEALRWGTVNSASVLGYIGPQAGLLTPQGMTEWVEKTKDVSPSEF